MPLTIFLAATIASGCASMNQASVRGTIVSASADIVRVRHKTGQVVTIRLEPTTRVVEEPMAAGVRTPRTGLRAVVILKRGEPILTADEVRLYPSRRRRGT